MATVRVCAARFFFWLAGGASFLIADRFAAVFCLHARCPASVVQSRTAQFETAAKQRETGMLQLDLTNLNREELEKVADAMFATLSTYASLNQRLYDAFKEHSKDDLPALVEAWASAVAQVDDRAEARIHAAIKPAFVTQN